MRTETKLAMAAAFNATMLTEEFMTQANLKKVLVMEMENYLRLDDGGSQFNAENVLSELKAVPMTQGATRNSLTCWVKSASVRPPVVKVCRSCGPSRERFGRSSLTNLRPRSSCQRFAVGRQGWSQRPWPPVRSATARLFTNN